MVVKAGPDLHLTLLNCLMLSVERLRAGKDPKAHREIHELLICDWIGPASDGGWLLH
jgi:hypothetical protein